MVRILACAGKPFFRAAMLESPPFEGEGHAMRPMLLLPLLLSLAGEVLAESWGLGLSEGLARLHVTGLAMAEAEEADAVEAGAAGAVV